MLAGSASLNSRFFLDKDTQKKEIEQFKAWHAKNADKIKATAAACFGVRYQVFGVDGAYLVPNSKANPLAKSTFQPAPNIPTTTC